jgi:DNA-binding NarL/FixJ family response regulator
MANPVLVGVNDLLFSAKIDAAAKALGVPLKCFPTCDRVLDAGREAAPPAIILDLESVGGDTVAFIETLKSGGQTENVQVIAFGRHTNAETLAAAERAGADRVMPRSEFVLVLPDILRACAETEVSGAENP